MKKLFPYLLLFILAMLIWDATFDPYHMSFHGDDDSGPLGAVFGALLAGGGILIGMIVMVAVGIILAVVFAGVGIVACVVVVLAAVLAALAISPLLLPLLVPLAIIWYISSRNRQRQLKQA
jgi:hypothetical protein